MILGIEPYPVSRPASEDFAYLGDVFGQFVVVKIGHPWGSYATSLMPNVVE